LVLVFWKSRDFAPIVGRAEVKPSSGAFKLSRENHMVVSCPGCKKVFSKPLVMLDFSGGKTRLVNVCPYCNRVLGDVDAGEKERDGVRVRDLEEKVEKE